MAAILLAGGPGSGKSAVSQALRDQGLSSIDLDLGFARWEDNSGAVVGLPESPTRSWLDHHYWRWGDELDRALLLGSPGPTLFAGTAADMLGRLGCFDLVIVLVLDSASQHQRLTEPRRDNDFGKYGESAAWSDDYRVEVESALLARSAVAVDARRPLADVVESVLAICRLHNLALAAG